MPTWHGPVPFLAAPGACIKRARPRDRCLRHGMGHIVFAAPGIDRFHLHERLQRELQSRGHRASALLLDPIVHQFWQHQGLPCTLIGAEAAQPMRAPLADLAAAECSRLGLQEGSRRYHRTAQHLQARLSRLLPGLQRWFERSRPDLILLHGSRDAEQALVHFVARECGVRLLWTGDGLLPHTMQCDERGLDGDAAASHRTAIDYRNVANEPSLLQACLANLLGRTTPCALAPRDVHPPPLRDRLRLAGRALFPWQPGAFWRARFALDGWRLATADAELPALAFQLPDAPFLAVLLQDAKDVRVRLDAGMAPASLELVEAAVAAAAELSIGNPSPLHTVVVLPPAGLHRRERRALSGRERLHVVPANAAPEAATTAVCTVTINHPLAVAALLASTPVLHTGRALYSLPGVTHHVPAAQFGSALLSALRSALAAEQPILRERFLCSLLDQGHLWCSVSRPDHNGLIGLVQAIEQRIGERTPEARRLRYRKGPPWPLAAEGRGS